MACRSHNLLSIDLVASSGRVVRGRLTNDKLEMDVIHRFEHRPALADDRLRWDWQGIVAEVHTGLARAADACGDEPIASVSCSSWAQDFGLLDVDGELFYTPVSYRDTRTEGMPESFADVISADDLISRVGCGCTPVTAICQLHAMATSESDVLEKAKTLLFVADLIHL